MWPQNRLHRCAAANLSIAVAIEGQTQTLVRIKKERKKYGGQRRKACKIQPRIGCIYAHQPQSWPRWAKFSHGERLRTGFAIHARRIQSVHDASSSHTCQSPTNANGMYDYLANTFQYLRNFYHSTIMEFHHHRWPCPIHLRLPTSEEDNQLKIYIE